MKSGTLLATVLLSLLLTGSAIAADKPQVAIVIHGGAGTILKENMTPQLEQAYLDKLREAVTKGHAMLKAGKPGEEVVVATIQILEASPLFNAGVGAVYTYDGEHELDASIMHGGTRNAGAVAGVKTIGSPIAAAQAVMNHSPHVMLAGAGAEAFAELQGMQPVDNTMFNTERRRDALKRAKARMEQAGLYHGGQQGNERFGTVGAVVLDAAGNLVAGTSTGGMTAKRFGRVGDSPIIGAGTFADNDSCAVSATGHGEFFIRYQVAADICARMKYSGQTLQAAADTVINGVLADVGGDGGVIAVDSKGNIATPFNSAGMYRAKVEADGKVSVGIYQQWDERL
ncbi:isoaspartyl peptidase/L-asparaginase [Alteromonas sp. ASW11-19]|uniref:Isoaspartyl peptidase/L-asparaginase n=1 Tax=Alteromonas salexigens TaxID=2982530 RepID=A0ABT2VPU3_9ALTE|nr:isoaspartyl peptidase/L-asparaginase [Alteromonas salexigens]MCU7553934.1 isoaspartyl peptidase/L-asparaginase [Alteromonas salexigens]